MGHPSIFMFSRCQVSVPGPAGVSITPTDESCRIAQVVGNEEDSHTGCMNTALYSPLLAGIQPHVSIGRFKMDMYLLLHTWWLSGF